jgi:hypothetical protein
VVDRYLRASNPIAEFAVTEEAGSAALRFVNSGEDAGLGRVEAYEHQWFSFDNGSGRTDPLGPPARATSRALAVPPERPAYLMVRIRTLAEGLEGWGKPVDIYLETGRGLKVVGVERGQ